MVGISKIKEQIMKAQKVRHPSKANLNNSTVGLSQMEEKYESLLELPSLQSRKALLDSKVKFSEIFRSSPNAIAITTLEDGRFIEVSDSYTQITGYTREEVIGRSSAELGFWVEAEARTRILRMLKEQGRVRREEVHMRIKSGEEHVGLFSSEPIDIDGEPCMLSVVVDITELKRAEEALQTTLKTALDGFWRTNLEGKLLEVNDSYCKMVGYTREELLKMSIPEIEYVESPKEVTQRIKRIAEQGYDRFETRHKRKDGSIIDVEISVNYLGLGEGQFFVFARDITERKRAEEALKLRAQILDSATDSIFLHDFDGNFVYVNETACRTHGYSREEFMKMKLTQVIAPERVSRLDSDFQEMLEKGQVIFESTHLRKDGSIIPVEVHGRTIESGGGKLILTVIRDITERKAAEEALRESEEKYRDLLDNTSDLIQSVKPDGRFRYVNNGWRQALGYSEEEISKLTIFDILHPDCLQN
jgi:PAS domain S-box-containing protein